MDKLIKLDKTLQGLSKRSIQFLIDFVSLPLLVLLKFYSDNPLISKKPAYIERVNECILQALGTLYHNVVSINQDLFKKSFDAILKFCDSIHMDLTNRYEKNDRNKYVSDEILIGLSRTCSGLFKSYDDHENGHLLSSREMFPSYGYLIFKFLEMASKDRNRQVQLHALEAVFNFVNNVHNIEIVSNILPGLISSMVRIITGDYKQGNKVFVYAFKILSVSIVKTMNDKESGFIKETITTEESLNILKDLKDNEKKDSHQKQNEKPKDREGESVFVQRDKAWFKKASYFVNKSLNQIFSISRIVAEERSRNVSMAPIIFNNPSTRMALIEAACIILKNCYGVLKDSVPSLIEMLILHTFDEYQLISNYAKKEMESFIHEELSRQKVNTTHRSFLFNSISNGFFRCVSTLPRIIRLQDDERKLISLKLFAGYIYLLQDKVDEIFITKLPKIASTLYSILSFDMTDIRVVRKRANILMLESSMEKSSSQYFEPTKYIYSFEHFKDPRIQSFISLICRIIGKYCNNFLFDFFLQEIKSDSIEQANPNKKEALFIMNELILGSANIIERPESLPDHELSNDLKIRLSSILFDYIAPNVWNTLYNSNDISSSYEHILCSSLLLEGVGNIAQVLGKEFNEKMMYVIYPILVKLGDSSHVVNNAAYNTLLRIALYCEYESIMKMIQVNTDYIINSIYTNMRYLKDYSSSLLVLHAIIIHASESTIPILMDVIDEIFRGLDTMSINYQHSFLKILHDIVTLIQKKIPGKIEDKPKTDLFPTIHSFVRRCDEVNNKNDLSIFISSILSMKKEREEMMNQPRDMDAKEYFTKLHESRENEDENEVENDTENDDLDEKEVIHPEGYDFVKVILEKMQHFTSVSNLESRVTVLDIINRGLYVLSEDEKVLLPTCHTLWDSLKYRFIDTDNRIMAKALDIMKTMSILTKDFVKLKFCDDLWPSLKSQLIIYNTFNKESKQIKRNDIMSQYTPFTGAMEVFGYSSSFRIQSSILNCLISACKYLSLHESTLKEIVHTCWFYLSSSQPKQLQQLSLELFSELYEHIPGFIWMLLIELSQKIVEPTDSSLPIIIPKKSISNRYKIPETHIPQFYSQFHKNADILLSKHFYCPIIKTN